MLHGTAHSLVAQRPSGKFSTQAAHSPLTKLQT